MLGCGAFGVACDGPFAPHQQSITRASYSANAGHHSLQPPSPSPLCPCHRSAWASWRPGRAWTRRWLARPGVRGAAAAWTACSCVAGVARRCAGQEGQAISCSLTCTSPHSLVAALTPFHAVTSLSYVPPTTAGGNPDVPTAAQFAGDPTALRRELSRRVRERMSDRADAGMAADPVRRSCVGDWRGCCCR